MFIRDWQVVVMTTHWRKAREICLGGESGNVHGGRAGPGGVDERMERIRERARPNSAGHTDLIGDLARIVTVCEQRIGQLEGRQG